MNSFQALTKAKAPLASTPGAQSGSSTRKMKPTRVQPSSSAASSSSAGSASKKPLSMKAQSGMVKVQYTTIRPPYELSRPICRISR